MSEVKLYSNFVKKENALKFDSLTQEEEILLNVKLALVSGAKEICFNYTEEGPEESSPTTNEALTEVYPDPVTGLYPGQEVASAK